MTPTFRLRETGSGIAGRCKRLPHLHLPCNCGVRVHIAPGMLLFDWKTARVLITVLLFAAVLGLA
jgi:hypothetical protein